MNERRFIELVEYNIYDRGNIIDVRHYQNVRRNFEAYTSLFTFKEDIVDYVKNNISPKTKRPSPEGYIGECSAKYLWIDIDVDGNLQLATKYMLELVDRIEKDYSLTYKSLLIFFSGNKGYHVGIPTKCFGADEYSGDILPQTFKLMVKILTEKQQSGIDLKIYNTTRLFRCMYSLHPKTQAFKIPVSVPLIISDGYDLMLQYSSMCNKHCDYALSLEYSDKLKKLFEDCVTQVTNDIDVFSDSEGYDTSLSTANNSSIFRIPQKGERNDLIYKQAYRLFAIKGLKVSEISDIMKFLYDATNEYSAKKGWDRYSEMEFKVSINSAYQRTRLRVVRNSQAKAFHTMAKAMYDKIKNAVYAQTIIPEITKDLGGGWQLGNSYALIGKGGTMKSYFLQEEMVTKSLEEKKDSLFCNLEMADTTFYDRVWTALFFKSMTDMIKSGELNDNNIAEAQEKVAEVMMYLHVFNGVDIEPEDLTNIVKHKEDEIKRKISLVGIDSVGGMKLYNDSEAMTALKLSKGIKEAAKNTNTAIITINHARNDCPVTMRDCATYVRGGSKYVDNCDAYISMSSVISEAESNFTKNPPDVIYASGLKYLRFVNKRGTGRTINKIIKFLDSGRIEVTSDSPSSYEVDVPSQSFYG